VLYAVRADGRVDPPLLSVGLLVELLPPVFDRPDFHPPIAVLPLCFERPPVLLLIVLSAALDEPKKQ
jgi:hypothetical protein